MKYKTWTDEETNWLIDNYQTNGPQGCAAILHRNFNHVRTRAWHLKLKYNKPPRDSQAYSKKYRQDNQTKIAAYKHQIYLINKDKIKAQTKKYIQTQLKTNPYFRLVHNIRGRIKGVLRLKNISKSHSSLALIGCDIDTLRKHLESRFQSGMTWDNYGKWHVDHIRPCASFNLADPEQQKICFNYKNLQPLWAIDNLRKNSKII